MGTVEITGIGVVHPLGKGVKGYWNNLVAGQCSFTEVSPDRRGNSPSKIGAELHSFSLSSLFKKGKGLDRLWPRPVQLGLAAAAYALEDAGINVPEKRNRLGLIVGTSVGNLETAFEFRDAWKASGRPPPPHTAFFSFHHSIASVVSAELDVRGPCYTISQGCNSGMDALGLACSLIKAGSCDAVLVIGSDNELTPEVMAALNGSSSLSSRYNAEPQKALRPFDAERDGNVLGEGACAYLLEDSSQVESRHGRAYARVNGFSITCAGGGRQYSAADPKLETNTFKRAILQAVGVSGADTLDIPYVVCANGSGSKLYDRLEAVVLNELLVHNAYHQIFSIKGAVGQHGAPSAALQIVSSALCLATDIVPPTLNLDSPIPELSGLNVVTAAQRRIAPNIICNSIGLGGFFYSAVSLTVSPYAHHQKQDITWGEMRLAFSDEAWV